MLAKGAEAVKGLLERGHVGEPALPLTVHRPDDKPQDLKFVDVMTRLELKDAGLTIETYARWQSGEFNDSFAIGDRNEIHFDVRAATLDQRVERAVRINVDR